MTKANFNAMYDLLYNDSDFQIVDRNTRTRLARQFDDFMLIRGDFYKAVVKFCKARHDPITSDREAAAFVLAYNFCR